MDPQNQEQVSNISSQNPKSKSTIWVIIIVVVAVLIVGGGYYYFYQSNNNKNMDTKQDQNPTTNNTDNKSVTEKEKALIQTSFDKVSNFLKNGDVVNFITYIKTAGYKPEDYNLKGNETDVETALNATLPKGVGAHVSVSIYYYANGTFNLLNMNE